MKEILIIGAGFAGLWSAASAVRQLDSLNERARVTLLNPTPWHSIRVRNYEDDLEPTRVELASVLDPIGVNLVLGNATTIDTVARQVSVEHAGERQVLPYDTLILASGSHLVRPPTPGVAEHTFDVDTFAAAQRLQQHIKALPAQAAAPGQLTAIVIGSGATGVELACELPARLRAAATAAGNTASVRIILADRGATIGRTLGGGQAIIETACSDLGIQLWPHFSLSAVDDQGVILTDGTRIDSKTVVWCAGMKANELTECIPAERDSQGRLKVDAFMRVEGVQNVFAAGDVAHALIDGEHPSVMSCQHARPMGRYAGHNAVNQLFGQPLEPLSIDWYTNIVDLGPWGALYMQGRDRVPVAQGMQAKETKTLINTRRIYPPRNGTREQILQAAALNLQRPPELKPLQPPNAGPEYRS